MLFDFFLLLLLCISLYLNVPLKSQKIIYIPNGSIPSIVSYLSNKGYALNAMDKYFMRLAGHPQSGFINIEFYKDKTGDEVTLTKAMLFYALANSKAAMKSITLIPGETSYFLLQNIAKDFNLELNDLENEYKNLSPYNDGVILANTYKLPIGANANFIIKHLVNTSLAKHKELAIKYLGHYDERQWFQIVTKASIIQKEAANVYEMPIVSSVIDNRIKRGMALQMDGSLNYGKYSHTAITPQRIKSDNTHFNTYKFKGLPREPSGSVSIDSINAALYPIKSNYLYFMRTINGDHHFSENYKEHLKSIDTIKKAKNLTK